MKRNFNILIALFLSMLVISSCEKEDFNYPEGYVGTSKITAYPILELKGDRYTIVAKGGTYTEPGITAKEGDNDITYTTEGTVNTAAAGVYTVYYSAENKDGFSASTFRTVIVYSTDAGAAARDLSGKYARNTNASIAEWTKIAPGVYKVFNPGGAPGTNLTVIAFNPTGYQVLIPKQISSDGLETSSGSEDYSGMPLSYKWAIVNPGYGPAVRTFVKQ